MQLEPRNAEPVDVLEESSIVEEHGDVTCAASCCGAGRPMTGMDARFGAKICLRTMLSSRPLRARSGSSSVAEQENFRGRSTCKEARSAPKATWA